MNRIALALIAAVVVVALVGCKSTEPGSIKPAAEVAAPVAETAKPVAKVAAPKPAAKPVAKPAAPAKPAAKPVAKVAEAAKPVAKPVAKVAEAAKPVAKPVAKVAEAAKPAAPPKPKEVPAPPKEVAAAAPKPAPEPAKPLGDVKVKSWGIPGAADPKAWIVQNWHNPATFGEDQGALKVIYEGGQKDKTSVALRLKADLSSRTTLVLDVNNLNTKAVGLSLTLMTTKGDKYFESPMTMVKPGLVKEVSFDLTASNYKKPSSQWKHTARVEGLDSVEYLCLVVYDKEKGSIAFSNMKLLAD